jgi:hypothetical protein
VVVGERVIGESFVLFIIIHWGGIGLEPEHTPRGYRRQGISLPWVQDPSQHENSGTGNPTGIRSLLPLSDPKSVYIHVAGVDVVGKVLLGTMAHTGVSLVTSAGTLRSWRS